MRRVCSCTHYFCVWTSRSQLAIFGTILKKKSDIDVIICELQTLPVAPVLHRQVSPTLGVARRAWHPKYIGRGIHGAVLLTRAQRVYDVVCRVAIAVRVVTRAPGRCCQSHGRVHNTGGVGGAILRVSKACQRTCMRARSGMPIHVFADLGSLAVSAGVHCSPWC